MTILSERTARRANAAPSRALHYLPSTALALDAVLMVAATVLAALGRRHLAFFDGPADVRGDLAVFGPLLVLCWLGTLGAFGSYRAEIFGAGADEFKRVFHASMYAAGVIGVGCYVFKYPLSRGFFLLAFAVGVPALLLGRALLRRAVHAARARGVLQQRVVIVGGPAHVDEIAAVLRRERWLGYHVVGALVPHGRPGSQTASAIPVLGDAHDLTAVAAVEGADVIFFTGGTSRNASDLRRIVWRLEERSIQLVMAPSITDMSGERVKIRPVGGLPLVHIDPPTWGNAIRFGKRAFDIVGSLVLIAALAPVFVFAALRIKLHDGGPVLFRQTRTGRAGAEFACLKFRTMVVDAEARLKRLQEEAGYTGGLFKLKDDPRITGPGKWLRRLSLDELPQLFNVLRGDMSLVGPRPPLPSEVAQYDVDVSRRLHVRPGMTGLWQVSGRSDLSWEEAVRLDLYYVDNWSMLQDLSILARTFGAVFASRGAY